MSHELLADSVLQSSGSARDNAKGQTAWNAQQNDLDGNLDSTKACFTMYNIGCLESRAKRPNASIYALLQNVVDAKSRSRSYKTTRSSCQADNVAIRDLLEIVAAQLCRWKLQT